MEDICINELVNEEVLPLKKVLLIDENGTQLGILPANAALAKCIEKELDLVCVAPNATIPVCKIMNYGKFKYERQRNAKLAKKNAVKHETKEIQIRYGIASHDMEVKGKSVKKFLENGDSVRVVMRLTGREQSMLDFARTKFSDFLNFCGEFTIKKELYQEGRDLKMILDKKK